jgi:ubiquinone/menaquinone biosynthesis C-methylase UbiE/uncharacterized protein YbaR (Trm112 family)
MISPSAVDVFACPICHGGLIFLSQPDHLSCSKCQKDFPIHQDIPYFIKQDELSGLNRRFARLYDWFSWVYRPFSKMAFAFIGMAEEQGRREMLDRLQPGGGRVLEVSIGPGVNLPYLVNRTDVGEIFGLDISLGQLKRCRAYTRRNGWQANLALGNAEQLPFKDETFSSVFHIGGINFFSDKRQAIEEMVRVAKPGSRMLISDETEKGARGYERVLPGFKNSFSDGREPVLPPVELLPPGMQEVQLFDVWKGWFYCIEFRKP